MTQVQESLEHPGGEPAARAAVVIWLAGSDGAAISEAYADGETIVQRLHLRADNDGDWTADLVPNADITPAGTAWARTVAGSTVYLDVPSAGPVRVDEILTEAPASIDTSTYAALAARVAVLEATAVTEGTP